MTTRHARLQDIYPVHPASQEEINDTLHPQRHVLHTDLLNRRSHRVELYIGQRSGSRRNDIMGHLPIPRHQFQGIRDSGKEDQAYREEGNHQ